MIKCSEPDLHPEAVALLDRFNADDDVDLATKLAFEALMKAASRRACDQQVAKAVATGEDAEGMLVGGPSIVGILEVLLPGVSSKAGYVRAFAESRIPRCGHCGVLMDNTPAMLPPPRQKPQRAPWGIGACCSRSACRQALCESIVKR